MAYCPYCEWDISETAQKCKHCWEWVVKESIEQFITNNKTKVKTEETNSKLYNKKISKFLSEYWILLIVWLIIIAISALKPNSNSSSHTNFDNIETTNELIDSTFWYYELVGNNKEIIPTENWFTIFQNTVWECEIRWEDEIINFVDAVRDAKEWEIIQRTCNNNKSNNNNYWWKNIAILFDNSYSKDLNWNIDKSWPRQRMISLWNYLTNNDFTNWSIIDLVFMFTVKPNDNSEEPDSNLYQFLIDTSKFKIVYVKHWKWKPFYDDKRKTLIYRNVQLLPTISWNTKESKCISNGNYNFICYDAESIYKKIYDTYIQKYDKEDKHTNNMFIKTLAMNKDRFSSGKKDEIYIFTNWEFKIGYERETMYLLNLKQKYIHQRKHDVWADKTHNLTEFNMRHANRYQKDNKYESFRNEAINVLHPLLPACEWVKISIIWLTRSTEFKPLAQTIYNKIFAPCEVLFQ